MKALVVKSLGIATLATVAAYVVMTVISYIIPQQQSGVPLAADKLADLVQQVTEAYYKLTELLTLTFAAVSVLVSYQQKPGTASTPPGPFVAASVICLGFALMLAHYSREVLLEMVSNNAIDLSEPTLKVGRKIVFSLLIAGLGLVGLFAMRLALGTDLGRGTRASGQNEDTNPKARA